MRIALNTAVPSSPNTYVIWKLAFSWGSFELPGASWGPPNPLGTFGPERVCSLYNFCARTRRRAGWGLLDLITELASVTEPQASWDSFGPPGISLGAHLNCLGPPGVHQTPWARLGLKAYVLFTISAHASVYFARGAHEHARALHIAPNNSCAECVVTCTK